MIIFKNFGLISAIFAILILGAYLRIKDLTVNPPGFYTDEASIGYNAYKILTTGRDEHGKRFPVFFKAFGEYKNPLAIYPVVPSIAILGPTEFSVRIVQAVWGTLVILMVFFLGKELFGNLGGILSAFVLAISPWHIHLSRFNIESHNAFLFFVSGGLLFTLISVRKRFQINYLIFASLFWSFSLYTYFATRIFTPLFLAGLIIIFLPELILLFKRHLKIFLISLFIFFLTVLPFAIHVISGEAFSRYKQVSPFAGGQANIIEKSKKLYIAHFDPKFAFFLGDSGYPGQNSTRLSVTGIGEFYKWQLPFFLVGLVYLLLFGYGRWGYKARNILIWMLVLYPLGSVVSDAQTPYATRSVIGVIAYTLIIAVGFLAVLEVLRKLKPAAVSFFSQAAFFGFFFLLSYVFLLRFEGLSKAYINVASGYSGFQYGMREVVAYFTENNNNFDMLVLFSGADGGDAYLNFYSFGRCTKCYWGDKEEGNLSIKKLIAVSAEERTLFDLRYTGTLMKTIYYPDGREAFMIYDAKRVD